MRIVSDRSGKLPMAVIIFILIVSLAGGAFAFLKMSKKLGGGAKHEKKVELSTWQLGEFVVNLADPGEPRYLKVNVTLEVEAGDKAKGGGHGEAGADPDEVRAKDAVITAITKKRYSDLIAPGGKDTLKEEMKAALNEALHDKKVANIFFTSFAMQ